MEPRREDWSNAVKLVRALLVPARLQILWRLGDGPLTVEELVDALDTSDENVVSGLRILGEHGLVERDGDGPRFRLARDDAWDLVDVLMSLETDQHAGLEAVRAAYIEDRSSMSPIDAAALLERARTGDLVVISVRSGGRRSDARSDRRVRVLPLKKVKDRLRKLRPDATAGLCLGKYCVLVTAP